MIRSLALACAALPLLAGCAAVSGTTPVQRAADFAAEVPGLMLDFPVDSVDRRKLPDGRQLLTFTGAIRNVGDTQQTVPRLRLILRDSQGRAVYSMAFMPEKLILAPGESLPVSEALMDIPASAKVMEVGWDHP